MNGIPPWAEAIPSVSTFVECDGARHELRWEAGRLVPSAHPDVDAEHALAALGGEAPACLRLRANWEAHASEPALVTLGRRPGEAGLGFAVEGSPTTIVPTPRRATASDDRRGALMALLSLPAPFIDRLVLGAMASAVDRWSDSAFREWHGLRLGAALAARATPALRRLGSSLAAADETVVVHCEPGDDARVRARRSVRGLEVTAALPVAWLVRVWGPGLSEPGGQFVLDVRGREVDVTEWVGDAEVGWEGVRRRGVLETDAEGATVVRLV
ncbi:MAG: hypothetical protein M3Q68_02935 [Actinomycetota bacterium]|nr:hypothetical protein [Actinomycetota bacterium]